MDIMLVNLGPVIQPYIFQCIRQIRNVCDDRIIVAFSEPKNFIVREENVLTVNLDSIPKSKTWKKFNSGHFDEMGLDLWRYACERFYAMESIMEEIQLKNVLHIENDNLIYAKPDEEYFKKYFEDSIGLTQITETLLGAGVMYIDNVDALSDMNRSMNKLLDLGRVALVEKYGSEMLNEMRLLKIIHDEYPGLVKLFPIFPDDKSTFVYDCASWGQYLGGTYHDPGESYHDDSHLVGKEINKGNYVVQWYEADGLRYPVAADPRVGKRTPLFNLHIHSKQLEKWMSK